MHDVLEKAKLAMIRPSSVPACLLVLCYRLLIVRRHLTTSRR